MPRPPPSCHAVSRRQRQADLRHDGQRDGIDRQPRLPPAEIGEVPILRDHVVMPDPSGGGPVGWPVGRGGAVARISGVIGLLEKRHSKQAHCGGSGVEEVMDGDETGVRRGSQARPERGVDGRYIERVDASALAGGQENGGISISLEASPAQAIDTASEHPVDAVIAVAAVIEDVDPTTEVGAACCRYRPAMVEPHDEVVAVDIPSEPRFDDRTARPNDGDTTIPHEAQEIHRDLFVVA